ncbi:MAG: homoserine kinase [Synoicihabitans sp.]
MNSVTVSVPGSTSNCGAGFDTLGLALQVYNRVTLHERADATIEAATENDARAFEMVKRVVAEFSQESGKSSPGFTYEISGDVPVSRGLGSSVTVLAGVLAGLNAWFDSPLSRTDMARVLTRIEGHPDNATAGVWGGFCVSRTGSSAAEFVDIVRVDLPDSLKFVVVSPELEISTKSSRTSLPDALRFGEAVRSVNSATFLTAAMISGDFGKLRDAAEDYFHEPYRLPGIDGGNEAIRAGIAAGGLTGWLSGSGSSVLCVSLAESAEVVGEAMKAEFTVRGHESVVRSLAADNGGFSVG